LIVRTTDPHWWPRFQSARRHRQPLCLIDDGRVGVLPSSQSLNRLGPVARMGPSDWHGMLPALALLAAGSSAVLGSFLGPEPFGTLWLLLLCGGACACRGTWMAIRILARLRPPRISTCAGSVIEIRWR
jgi:hypothetical protein